MYRLPKAIMALLEASLRLLASCLIGMLRRMILWRRRRGSMLMRRRGIFTVLLEWEEEGFGLDGFMISRLMIGLEG